jgi:hypothetical protein
MVGTQEARLVSTGSRQTRREHRARKRQVQLKESINTTPKKSALVVVDLLVTVIGAVGRGISWSLLWGLIILIALSLFTAEKGKLLLAGAGRAVFSRIMPVAEKGFRRDPFLFVGLVGSGSVALTHVVMGKTAVAMLSCLLAVLMGVGLWIRHGEEEA